MVRNREPGEGNGCSGCARPWTAEDTTGHSRCAECQLAYMREYMRKRRELLREGKPTYTRPAARDNRWRRRVDGEGDCKVCGNPLTPNDCTSFGRRCRPCYNAWHREYSRTEKALRPRLKATLKYHYGSTLETWDALMAAQEGRCAICGRIPDGSRGSKDTRLHVDHCHETGRIRGLLCVSCNVLIGYCKENKETLRSAVVYLEKHKGI